MVLREESARGHDGGTWGVRFDCGTEASVALTQLRERWHMPTRIYALYGNFFPATVLESLGGLLRLDFGDALDVAERVRARGRCVWALWALCMGVACGRCVWALRVGVACEGA